MDTYRCINASRRPSSFNSVVRYSSRPACSPGSRRGLNIGVRVPAAGPGVGGGVDAPDMPIASSVRGDSGSVSSSSFNSPLVFPGVLAGYAERGGGVPGVESARGSVPGVSVAGVTGTLLKTGVTGELGCTGESRDILAGVVSGVRAAAASANATAASAAANAATAATSPWSSGGAAGAAGAADEAAVRSSAAMPKSTSFRHAKTPPPGRNLPKPIAGPTRAGRSSRRASLASLQLSAKVGKSASGPPALIRVSSCFARVAAVIPAPSQKIPPAAAIALFSNNRLVTPPTAARSPRRVSFPATAPAAAPAAASANTLAVSSGRSRARSTRARMLAAGGSESGDPALSFRSWSPGVFFTVKGNSNAGLDSVGFGLDASFFFAPRRSSRAFRRASKSLRRASLSRSAFNLSASTIALMSARASVSLRFAGLEAGLAAAAAGLEASCLAEAADAAAESRRSSSCFTRSRPRCSLRLARSASRAASRACASARRLAVASASLARAASSSSSSSSFRFASILFASSCTGAVPSSCLILWTSCPASVSFPRTASAIDLDFSLRADDSASAARLRSARASTRSARVGRAGELGGVGGVFDTASGGVFDTAAGESDASASRESDESKDESFVPAGLLRRRFSISSPAFVAIPVTSELTQSDVRRRSSLDSLSTADDAAAASRTAPTDAPAVLTTAPTTPPMPRTALTPRRRMSSRTSSRDGSARSSGEAGGIPGVDEGGVGVREDPLSSIADPASSSPSRDARAVPGWTVPVVSSAGASRESPRGASAGVMSSPTTGAFVSSAVAGGAVDGSDAVVVSSTASAARFAALDPFSFGSLSTSPALSRPFRVATAGFSWRTSS